MPPCCIDRKLPPLLNAGGAFSIFYSQGDWGLSSLCHAAMSLVQGNAMSVLVLADVDVFTLRQLANWMRHEWAGGIALVTAENRTELVRQELSDYLNRIWYAGGCKDARENNLWIRSSALLNLVVVGPLAIGEKDLPHRCCTYTASLQQSRFVAEKTFLPWRSILHLHAKIKGSAEIFKDWL